MSTATSNSSAHAADQTLAPAAAASPAPRGRLTVQDRAMITCTQVIDAYNAGGRRGGSIDWNDLDTAFEFAKRARAAERGLKRRGGVVADLSRQELATVLAALRLFQSQSSVPGDLAAHFTDCPPLSAGRIDHLCERLNVG